METKKIFLRKPLTIISLNYHLKRYFKFTTFSSEYIAIQTKYSINKIDAPSQTLGKYFYINLNNEGEITNYMDHLSLQFNELNKDVKSIYILSFTYLPTDKTEHNKFITEYSKVNPHKIILKMSL